jgi:hypothetical protein
MMAYRATAHETTGFSPNMLMLGRETSTPLDLVYDMPPGIKPVPANMWAWELRERIEEAHAFVRKYSEGSILRQKTYHDKRASWERFEANDIVYVFFHVSLHILFLLKHLATNFTRELCHLFDTLEEMCLQLHLIRKIPTA